MGADAMTIAFLIFGLFVFIAVLASGILSRGKRVALNETMDIDEAEALLMDDMDEDALINQEKKKLGWLDKKTRQLQQTHSGITIGMYLAIMFAVGLILFFLAYFIFKEVIFALIAACFGYIAPEAIVKMKVNKNIATFNANPA